MFLSILITALIGQDQAVTSNLEPLHPALVLSSETFDKVWSKALADGQKKKGKDAGLDKMRRQIDSYHVSLAKKEACSWIYWMHPRAMIHMKANGAGLQYWPQAEIDKAKSDMAHYADSEQKFIGFYVQINEMPSFAAPYGRLRRHANPDNLKNVRCVLKVGDRIIQPVQQPGDITTSQKEMVSFYSIPTTTYVNGSTRSSATAYGSNGSYATATGYSTSSYQVTRYASGADEYQVFSGQTTVLFPTRDKDGKPLITPKDKNIEIKMVREDGEIHTTYRLDDWIKAFE